MNHYDYILNYDFITQLQGIDCEDEILSYDYNEVQELFYAIENNFIFLIGNTGLKKKLMLMQLLKDIIANGTRQRDILYLDYHLPFTHEIDAFNILNSFVDQRKEQQCLYLFINEIHFIEDFMSFIKHTKDQYPNVKLICTSSAAPILYEKLYDEGNKYFKVIVLSDKNKSNTKTLSDGFGVYDELKYNIKGDFIEIKGLTKTGKKRSVVTVPNHIEGKIVKYISSGAFHDRSELLHINLPDSIEMIGDYSFTKCISLERIVLPKQLKYIGENAFLGSVKLKNITGGENLEHIGNSAFYATEWLNSYIDDNISLGNVLYKYQGSNQEVIVPKNITSINNWAFSHNDAIETVIIKNSNCLIGEGTFFNCQNLRSVNNMGNTIHSLTFAYCRNLAINSSIAYDLVGDYAFYNCDSIKQVSIKTKTIGHCAFFKCSNLSTVYGDITRLGNGAFYCCLSLGEMDMVSLNHIDAFALYETAFTKVEIQADYIGDYALANNHYLTEASVDVKEKIGKGILNSCYSISRLVIGGRYKLPYYFVDLSKINITDITIIDDVVVDNIIRNYFPVKNLSLYGIKKIGKWAFCDCKNLEKVYISDGINEISDWAFTNCESLKSVILPESVNKIGMNAFRYCKNLNEIKLAANDVVSFGVNALYATPEDKKIIVHKQLLEKYKRDRLWEDYAHNLVDNQETNLRQIFVKQ